MVVLGIVLATIAVLLGLGVAVSSNGSTTLEVFGVELGVAVPTVFFLGAATGVALMLGLWLAKLGLGRGYRRHQEIKELRQQVEAGPGAASTGAAGSSHDSVTGKERAHRLGTEPYTVADDSGERSPASQRRSPSA